MKRLTAILSIPMIALCVMMSGCVVLESSSISSGATGGQKVSASASDWGVLALTAPYGVTSAANSQLASQCQSGKVGNIQTELSMRNWVLVQVYSVTAAGVCE